MDYFVLDIYKEGSTGASHFTDYGRFPDQTLWHCGRFICLFFKKQEKICRLSDVLAGHPAGIAGHHFYCSIYISVIF